MNLGIVLTREHRLLSVAAILDVFETVNRFYKEEGHSPFFTIELVHTGNVELTAFSGYVSKSIASIDDYHLLLIPAFKPGPLSQFVANNHYFIPWLRQQYQNGATIASFCTGTFLLGASGLLDNRSATTHIDAADVFANTFPKVKLQADAVITQDDGLCTSGGATNSFHLMLKLIEIYCGRKLAVRTAKVFSIDLNRQQQGYFRSFYPPEDHGDDLVKLTQQKIKEQFSKVNTVEEIITDIPSSRRNLVRRFKHATGITPIEYLQKTRIEAAKELLEQSKQSILQVMIESGYNDLKNFRSLFKRNVGMTPKAYREKFNGSHVLPARYMP